MNNFTTQGQATQIFDKICNETKLYDLYTAEFHDKNPVAKNLFHTGIEPEMLTPNYQPEIFQDRFETSLKDPEGTIVFYPTPFTAEVFRTILKMKRRTFNLTSQKRVGKSFSAALFVVLMRLSGKRVLYINSSLAYSLYPVPYVGKELLRAFPNELKKLNITYETFLKINERRTDEAELDFRKILLQTVDLLNQKNKETYVVFDQVNALEDL